MDASLCLHAWPEPSQHHPSHLPTAGLWYAAASPALCALLWDRLSLCPAAATVRLSKSIGLCKLFIREGPYIKLCKDSVLALPEEAAGLILAQVASTAARKATLSGRVLDGRSPAQA